MLRIAVVDDVKQDLLAMEQSVKDVFPESDVWLFHNLPAFLGTRVFYDLVLMDMKVGENLSRDFISSVCRKSRYVLYVSEIEEMVDLSFHASVVGYHFKSKGVRFLKETLRKIDKEYFHEEVSFWPGSETFPAYLSNIRYIHQKSRTKWLYKDDGAPIPLKRIKFEDIIREYPDAFIQVSRDTIVNVSFIIGFDGNQVILRNGEKLKVSRRRLNEVKRRECEINGWKR